MTVRSPYGRWAARAFLAAATAAFIYLARSIFPPFILAFFLAYLIEPLVLALQHRGAPRCLAILTVFIVTVLLLVVFVAVVAPLLIADLEQAARALPRHLTLLIAQANQAARLYQRLNLPLNIRALLDRLAAQATTRVEEAIAAVLALLLRLLPHSMMLFLVPFIAYYISRDYQRARRALYDGLARWARPGWLVKAVAVDRVLRAYFRGQALEILIMTIVLVLGLSLLGLEFALLIGILAGLLNIIPYFGPLLGALPAVFLALTRSPWQAAYVVVLFIAANQFEAWVLVPRVMGTRVGLHPVIVLFALLVGGRFFGLLGLVLAVPIAAVLKVVTAEYLRSLIAPDPGLTTPGASGMMDAEAVKPKDSNDGG